MSNIIQSDWSYAHIIASYCISWLGAYTTLHILRHRTGPYGMHNWILLVCASISLGGVGIWTMHFVGMCAVEYSIQNTHTTIPITYRVDITIVSLLACCICTTIAICICRNPSKFSWYRIVGSGIVCTCGVCIMHYIGMMAMHTHMNMNFDAGIVAGSVIIGLFASTAALIIFFRLQVLWKDSIMGGVGCACIMALAVNCVHYVGMISMTYHDHNETSYTPDNTSYPTSTNIMIIALCISGVWCIALLSITQYMKWKHTSKSSTEALMLRVVMMNNDGQILLSANNGELPSCMIEHEYMGVGLFDVRNKDFVRMFQASTAWHTVDDIANELHNHCTQSGSAQYSYDLFMKFINTMKSICTSLNTDVHALGNTCVMYPKLMDGSILMVFLVKDSGAQYVTSSLYKFAPLHVADAHIKHIFPTATATIPSEQLIRGMVRNCNQFYLPLNNADLVYMNGGKQSTTPRADNTTSNDQYIVALLYSRVGATGLEAMIGTNQALFLPYVSFNHAWPANNDGKAALDDRSRIALSEWSKQTAMNRRGSVLDSTIDISINKGHQRSRSNSIHTQVHKPPLEAVNSMDVVGRRSGSVSYNRPQPTASNDEILPLSRQTSHTTEDHQQPTINTLAINTNITNLTQVKYAHAPSRSPSSMNRTGDMNEGSGSTLLIATRLRQRSGINNGLSGVPGLPLSPSSRLPLKRNTPPNMALRIQTATAEQQVSTPIKPVVHIPDCDSPMLLGQTHDLSAIQPYILTPSSSKQQQPHTSDEFMIRFQTAVKELATIMGTDVDLHGGNLYSVHPIQLTPTIRMFLFVTSNMKPGIPDGYNGDNIQFISMPIVDICLQAKYKFAQPSNWFRKAISDNVASKTNKDVHDTIQMNDTNANDMSKHLKSYASNSLMRKPSVDHSNPQCTSTPPILHRMQTQNKEHTVIDMNALMKPNTPQQLNYTG